ncbi:hypothetical protein [Roseibium sp.]|uniref:hypothetical protein n=1 Tax=Roseibium sp. TaxID=1936156 RepID=UPI003D13BB10
MNKLAVLVGILFLPAALAACAVGPGTPLVDALRTQPGHGSGNVPPPKGYARPAYAGESTGLINPEERQQTAEHLKSLANE